MHEREGRGGVPDDPQSQVLLAEAPRVEVIGDRIVVSAKIQFDFDEATIRPESHALQQEIARVIESEPDVEKVSIEGHTCILGGP